MRGRLFVRGQRRDVHAKVRHVTELGSSHGEYLVGLEFLDDLSTMDYALLDDARSVSPDAATPSDERRRGRRVDNPDGVEFEAFEWLTIELHDMSLGGAVFTTKAPLAVGNRARLHTRLGEKRFEVDVEVRRVSSVGRTQQDHRVGAAFVGIDEDSLRNLGSFLAGSLS